MSDIEADISGALRAGVDTVVPADRVDLVRLLDGARGRGRSLRRRRRIVTVASAGLATAVVLVVAAMLVPVSWPGRSAPSVPGGSGSPSATATTRAAAAELIRPPVAVGATPAAVDPRVVGAAGLFHLDLATVPEPVRRAAWYSFPEVEILELRLARQSGTVVLSREQPGTSLPPGTPVDIGGHPGVVATQDTYTVQLDWSPAPGLGVEIQWEAGPDEGTSALPNALALAKALRLDHTYRCASRAYLAPTPPGAVNATCSVDFNTGNETITSAGLTVAGCEVSVLVGSRDKAGPDATALRIHGYPATSTVQTGADGPLTQLFIDWAGTPVEVDGGRGCTTSQLTQYAESIIVAPGDDPRAWPAGLLG